MARQDLGLFRKFRENLTKKIDIVTKTNFANLECNIKRMAYLLSLPVVKEYDFNVHINKEKWDPYFPVVKKPQRANQLKEEANNAVGKGDFLKAISIYGECIRMTPDMETENLSLLFANRSAAFFFMNMYKEALVDILLAEDYQYPISLKYKLYERKGRCEMFLGRNKDAIDSFNLSIEMLVLADQCSPTRKQDRKAEMMKFIEDLKQDCVEGPEFIRTAPPLPKISGARNPMYPALSDAVGIKTDSNNEIGRHAIAKRNIKAGDVLVIEKPNASALLAEYSYNHCQHCFLECEAFVPCPDCPNVVFCNDSCLQAAQNSHHAYECSILPLLWKSGISVTCHIAFRIISQESKDYFLYKYTNLSQKHDQPYESEDYRNVFNLVDHANRRKREDFFHRAQMALFLLKLLEISGYFDGKPRSRVSFNSLDTMAIDEKYIEEAVLIGALILKNLQILKFNAHEVFELQCRRAYHGETLYKHLGKSTFIAGAVYPTLALFNHSCDPCVVRYFSGSTVIVRAVRNIEEGEEVSENYGPIFTETARGNRQTQLRDIYWFICRCKACTLNWVTYDEMSDAFIRFTCQSNIPCPNVIPVRNEFENMEIRCPVCETVANVPQIVNILTNADTLYRRSNRELEKLNYKKAMDGYIEVLCLFDSVMAKPYKSYYQVIQSLRTCMLTFGNYSELY